MRTLALAAVVLTWIGLFSPSADSLRAEDSAGTALTAAERALETAQLRLRVYERVDHPLRLRKLDSEITLIRLEIASYERAIAEYESISNHTIHSAPFFHTLEIARLALAAAQLRLADLEAERLLLVQHHPAQRRLYELEIESAQAQLEGLTRASSRPAE